MTADKLGTLIVGWLVLMVLASTIGLVFASVVVWIGLNVIAGFGLSFWQVVGIGYVLGYVASNASVSYS